MLAMENRASSLPPVVSANPFWSERARDEWQIQAARPQELPNHEEMAIEDESRPRGGEGRTPRSREPRRTSTGKGRGTKSETFATPPSRAVRGVRGGEGSQEIHGDGSRMTELQRELEKEMVGLLHGENIRLKREVEDLKSQRRAQEAEDLRQKQELEKERLELEKLRMEMAQGGKSSSWSEVSPSQELPEPPPSTPKQASVWTSPEEDARYTPQGTRVPSGPPPQTVMKEVPMPPSWMDWGSGVSFGDREGGRAEHLQDRVCHGDRASVDGGVRAGDRAEHHHDNVCQEDRASKRSDGVHQGDRALHGLSYHGHQGWHHQHRGREHGDPRGGQGRQGHLPEEERKAFEEEIKRLTQELEKKGQFQSDYWKAPTQKGDAMEVDQGQKGQKKDETTQVVSAMNEGNLGSGRELPELSGDITSITLGDWLVSIGPMMKDLTPLSAGWWQKTYQKAEEYYGMWRNSTPLQRVQIQPELPEELQQPQYMRTEQRGVGLLLKAVPKEMRDVLIASRELYSTTIIYRLLVTFQPGGANEKALLLKHLTQINIGKDLSEMGTALRTWRRFFKRAVEINTTLPDPTLLLKALDHPSTAVAKVDAQSAFRLAQTRSQLGVDEKPDQDSVWRFSQCVLAEIETLQLLNGTSTTSTASGMMGQQQEGGQVAAKVKALELKTKGQGKGSPGQAGKLCHFFGSKEGCKAGGHCKYQHDWNTIPDKQGRCWNCSSTTHMKNDCPSLRSEGQPRTSTGGSGDLRDGQKGKSKDKKGGGGKKAGDSKDRDDDKDGDERDQEQPAIKEVSVDKADQGGDKGKPGNSGSGGSQEGLMTEVTSLLKSLRMTVDGDPKVKVCHVKRLRTDEKASVLLDGGATHCMRERKSMEEWNRANVVKVQLASGEIELRQCEETATLLSDQPVQSIIPVAKVTELGYTVRWDRNGCQIEHMVKGKLPIKMNQGCPTIEVGRGEMLMDEIEDMERRKARVRAILKCNMLAENEYEKEVAALTSMFPTTPLRILEGVPGDKEWDPEQLPVNRRKRRQISKAKRIVIDMFAGPHEKRWRKIEDKDTAVVSIDILKGINVMDPMVSGWIDSLIDTGKVEVWLSGPPCRTVSACRQRGEEDGGPPQLRGRNGMARYGLQGLTSKQQELADHNATLWIKNARWDDEGQRKKRRCGSTG